VAEPRAVTGRPLHILLVTADDGLFARVRELIADVAPAHVLDRAPAHHDLAARLDSEEHDVVLSDLRLVARGADGAFEHDVFRSLPVPVVVIAADEDVSGDYEAMYAGAADCVGLGSMTATVLERSLRYAVERHREARLLRERAAALADSHFVHHSTFNDAPVGIAHIGLDGRWLRVNPRICEKLGYPVTELLAMPLAGLTHPEDLPDFLVRRDKLLSGEILRDTTEKRYRCADGAYRWLQVSASLHRTPSGEPRHFIAVLKDTSEQRRAEEELDHIFNLSPDMISTANYEGYFTRTNAAWSATLGYTAEELRAVPLVSFVHPDDREATLRGREHVLSGQTLFGFVNRYRTRSGDYRWIEWHTKADTQAKVIYAVARDRTESLRLEEQLRHSQKMEAIGRLAGGISHDFNNLLLVIMGFTEMTLEDLPHDDERRENLEQVRLAAESARSLTRQLLAFSRKQVLDPRVFDMNALVLETERMLGRIIGEDVDLVTDLTGAPCGVNADRAQIEHAILNLAVNARDAMPVGGTLRISTGIVTLDDDFVLRHPGARPGPHVVLRVTDTGVGMEPEVLAHAFEPFFTTKDKDKGTGLGLSTVYGTVQQSGGHVSIASTPGAGTTVSIALPHVPLPATSEHQAPAGRKAGAPLAETILVVEDKAQVRVLVRRTLLADGYHVLDVGSGQAALDLLQNGAPPIDLLLTDVVMPQMSGRELAAEVTRRFPATRVLYMSGYTTQIMNADGSLEDGVALIQKPFTPQQLRDRVRQALKPARR
jgi:PAS domain S-box-containing protein